MKQVFSNCAIGMDTYIADAGNLGLNSSPNEGNPINSKRNCLEKGKEKAKKHLLVYAYWILTTFVSSKINIYLFKYSRYK